MYDCKVRWICVYPIVHTVLLNALLLCLCCIPFLIFYLSCVPIFWVLPFSSSLLRTFLFPFPLFSLTLSPFKIFCKFLELEIYLHNLKHRFKRVTRIVCPSCTLPNLFPEEIFISCLHILLEICYTYPQNIDICSLLCPQMAAHYTKCSEPCFLQFMIYLGDHSLSVHEASFFL